MFLSHFTKKLEVRS